MGCDIGAYRIMSNLFAGCGDMYVSTAELLYCESKETAECLETWYKLGIIKTVMMSLKTKPD